MLREEDQYQNLEISLHYIFKNLFTILNNERYQESSILAKKAMAYIKQNFRKQINLNDLAKHLEVTPYYVSKIIKTSFGRNYTDVLTDTRIEAAKQLLKEHHRVKEIAFEVGFQNPSYFAKIFKKKVGLAPKEYQEFFL